MMAALLSHNHFAFVDWHVVSQIISKNNRHFTDAEFIKICMLAVVDEICPDKKKT